MAARFSEDSNRSGLLEHHRGLDCFELENFVEYGATGPGTLNANTVLYLVWRCVGRCTDAIRIDLVVFVAMFVVVAVTVSLPRVT